MDLQLWQLVSLALRPFVILASRFALVVLVALTASFWLMSRDDAAVMAWASSGACSAPPPTWWPTYRRWCGASAPPRAFPVVPLIGAFFSDLTNSVIITFFVN